LYKKLVKNFKKSCQLTFGGNVVDGRLINFVRILLMDVWLVIVGGRVGVILKKIEEKYPML
jgi:hypothetical protein